MKIKQLLCRHNYEYGGGELNEGIISMYHYCTKCGKIKKKKFRLTKDYEIIKPK